MEEAKEQKSAMLDKMLNCALLAANNFSAIKGVKLKAVAKKRKSAAAEIMEKKKTYFTLITLTICFKLRGVASWSRLSLTRKTAIGKAIKAMITAAQ